MGTVSVDIDKIPGNWQRRPYVFHEFWSGPGVLMLFILFSHEQTFRQYVEDIRGDLIRISNVACKTDNEVPRHDEGDGHDDHLYPCQGIGKFM